MLIYDPFRKLHQVIQESIVDDCPDIIGDLERLKALAFLKLTTPNNGAPVAGPERVYTIPEVAGLLKISEYRAYELARQGKLPHSKIGKSVRVSAAQLAAFQRSREI